jgi:purine-binding chemotaxis protein CheW
MSSPDRPDVVTRAPLQQLTGKYLTFRLCDEEFAIRITNVQEVVCIQRITRIPHSPDFLRGLMNLRGKVIHVMDLRRKFRFPNVEDTEKTRIVIVEISSEEQFFTMGIVVDEVKDVLEIHADCLNDTPNIGTSFDFSFILAVARIGENVIMLLDIERIMTARHDQAPAFEVVNSAMEEDHTA